MSTNQVKDTLRRLRPFLGKKVDSLWARWQTAEPDDRQDWEHRIQLLAHKFKIDAVDDRIILPPPPATDSPGSIELGSVSYLGKQYQRFGIDLATLTRHMGIFGSTGSGKTSLAKNILRSLYSRNIPFIAFDWESNYRDLLSEISDLKIFTVGRKAAPFHFNYLEVPPGLSYPEYVKSVVEVFSRAYIGGAGADSVLLKVFDQAYKLHDTPTTQDALKIMAGEMQDQLRGREMLWKQSTMRMFDFLCYGATGEMLSIRKNPPVDSLFKGCIVFELGGLTSPYDKRFFIEMFTLWYWLHLEHAGIEHETLKHVLLYEEFHNIVQGSDKEDFIQKLFRQIRKYGTGLIILDQTPSLIPNPIFENLTTKITFTLNHHQNVSAMANAMSLSPEERLYVGLLMQGQAICKVMGKTQRPFMLDVPYYQLGPNVPDNDLAKHMSQFSEYSKPPEAPMPEPTPIRSIPPKETLSPLGRVLFEDIAQKPFSPVSVRYKKLGLSAAEGTKIQKELLSQKLVKPVPLDGKKFLEPTARGKEHLKASKIEYSLDSGRGGLEHGYWIDAIRNKLASSSFVFVEQNDIDVVAYKLDQSGEWTIAIQVETGKSDIAKNIGTLGEFEADSRFMIGTNKPALAMIEKLLSKQTEAIQASVQAKLAKPFLSSLH